LASGLRGDRLFHERRVSRLPIIVPSTVYPKWARPEHFLNLFEWNGLASRVLVTSETEDAGSERPIYAINLNNQYRLDRTLASKKAAGDVCVYDAFDRKVWEKIERRNGVLLLDSAVEPLICRDDIAEGLLSGLEKEGIDPERVALLNNNLRARSLFEERYLGRLDRRPKIVDVDCCFWLLSGFNRMTDSNRDALTFRAEAVERSRSALRERKFVSFNGRLRPHRFFVVLWLLARGCLEDGLLSFLAYESKSRPGDLTGLKRALEKTGYPEFEDVKSSFDELIQRLPISIDISLEDSQRSAAYKRTLPWRSQSGALYDDAYFSIVVDTEFHNSECLFLTPIAFKSFMNFSPFIYFGNHGALRRMRELGFKTFAPTIDESYDDIADFRLRMKGAFQEIRRLCSMSQMELSELYQNLWPVLEHNYWNFYRDAPARAAGAFNRDLLGKMGFQLP
jgi:hypothetical protein